MVGLAEPKMAAAPVGADRQVTELRVSRNAWIPDGENEVVDSLSRYFAIKLHHALSYELLLTFVSKHIAGG